MSALSASASFWRRLGSNLTQQTPRLIAAAVTGLWRGLRHPLLALFLALLAGLLMTAGVLLPQLPGQLSDEPATAARWLLNAGSMHGFWGSFWLGLGLFDILHSPLTVLVGVVLALALSAHIAAQVATIRQMTTARHALAAPHTSPMEPLALARTAGLSRSRLAVAVPPAQTAAIIQAHLAQQFTSVQTPPEAAPANEQAEAEEPAGEQRFLAVVGAQIAWLRLLLPVGLLLTLGAVWYAIAFGWQVTTPALAPGDTFRAVNHNLELRYEAPETGEGSAALVVRLGSNSAAFSTARAQRIRTDSAAVNIRPAYPGVLVQMDDGAAELSRPGGTERSAQIGVVIADRGGEESVLLPKYGAGLRIVQRGATTDAFILELYRSNAVEPVFRAELTPSGRVTIPLDNDAASIIVSNMPGLQVDVRHEPGIWLAWVGLGIALIGLFAAMRRAGFILVQLAPWPVERTLATVQSNLPRDHARLVDRLGTVETEQSER